MIERSCWLNRNALRAAIVFAALFAVDAFLVGTGATAALDLNMKALAASYGSDAFTKAAGIATDLGTAPLLLGVAVLAGLLAWRAGLGGQAILPVLPLIGTWLTDPLLKSIFLRQRPTTQPWPPGFFGNDQYSFPSGHAMNSMGLYLLLICWAWSYAPGGWRYPLALLALLIPIVVGLSRIALGVHWTSDVVGGWFAGAAVASVVVLLWEIVRSRRAS